MNEVLAGIRDEVDRLLDHSDCFNWDLSNVFGSMLGPLFDLMFQVICSVYCRTCFFFWKSVCDGLCLKLDFVTTTELLQVAGLRLPVVSVLGQYREYIHRKQKTFFIFNCSVTINVLITLLLQCLCLHKMFGWNNTEIYIILTGRPSAPGGPGCPVSPLCPLDPGGPGSPCSPGCPWWPICPLWPGSPVVPF